MSDRSWAPARWADLIIPGIAVAYAIYYIASVWAFPFEAQISGFLLGSILIVLCAVFFGRFVWQALRGGTIGGVATLLGEGQLRYQRLVFLTFIIASIAAVPWGGFTLTTFLFLSASLLLFGVRPVHKALLVAAGAAIGGWIFFIVLLGTRFPRGPFERLVAWLV